MITQLLMDAVVANTTGDSFSFPANASSAKDEMVAQIEVPGTATVTIQGRLDSSLSWVDMVVATADALVPFAFVPHVRAVVSGWSSGATSVRVGWY